MTMRTSFPIARSTGRCRPRSAMRPPRGRVRGFAQGVGGRLPQIQPLRPGREAQLYSHWTRLEAARLHRAEPVFARGTTSSPGSGADLLRGWFPVVLWPSQQKARAARTAGRERMAPTFTMPLVHDGRWPG